MVSAQLLKLLQGDLQDAHRCSPSCVQTGCSSSEAKPEEQPDGAAAGKAPIHSDTRVLRGTKKHSETGGLVHRMSLLLGRPMSMPKWQ